jgi:hypothetical protein
VCETGADIEDNVSGNEIYEQNGKIHMERLQND